MPDCVIASIPATDEPQANRKYRAPLYDGNPRQPAITEGLNFKGELSPTMPKRKQKVLIVDDDKLLRRMAAALLEADGYIVSQASNGKEALDRASKLKPEVVLTELVLPELEGLKLIRELLTLEPSLYIVAMSGALLADNYLKIATRLGAKATLPKPLRGEELLETLRNVSLK